MKFGRKRPVAHCPHPRLKSYLKDIPNVPTSADYSSRAAVSLASIYLNDRYGDCVIAGGYHVVGVETGNADGGSPFLAEDAQIIADYSAIGGFDPNNPEATDTGCDEQTALNYWTQTGFANGTKLCGWMAVDATNKAEVMAAMYLFENLFFGIELPDSWVNPMPSDGFTWSNDTPNPANGHCVIGVGYNDEGVQVATWGMIGTITWDAIASLCTANSGGALYVMLSPDQVAKGQTKAPNGVDWDTLMSDFVSLGGNPAPIAPPPAPAPAPSVSLSEACAWAVQGIMENWPAQ